MIDLLVELHTELTEFRRELREYNYPHDSIPYIFQRDILKVSRELLRLIDDYICGETARR